MALNLAVLSSAERQFPHDTESYMVLGANVVVAATPPVAGADLDANWLQPWRWSPVTDVRLRLIGIDASGAAVDRTIAATVWAHPNPPAPGEVAEAKTALERRWDELKQGGSAAFVWDPRDPGAPPPDSGFHRDVVGGAATTAGALAHALNLAFTLKIQWTEFQPDDFSDEATHTFFEKLRLIVSPVVSVGGATLTPSPGAIPGDAVAEWAYVTAGGAPPATTFAPSVILNHADTPSRYFQLGKYWVQEPTGVPRVDPGDDWLSKLADRIADAWNLPQHLIDAVKRPLSTAEFIRVWEITLAAMRDRAGTGSGIPPDGRGLFRVAADLATPATLKPVDNAVREWRIESLREQFATCERTTSLPGWHQILQDSGSINDRVPLSAPVPPGTEVPVSALDPLAGAVAALADDNKLAAVIAEQWKQFATTNLDLDGAANRYGPTFTTRKLLTPNPTKFVDPKWVAHGTLDLTGRNSWAVNLNSIALVKPGPVWETGPKYELRFPSGDVTTPTETFVVEVVFGVSGPANAPTLTITLGGMGITPAPQAVVLPAGTVQHSLRVSFEPVGNTTNVTITVVYDATKEQSLAAVPLPVGRKLGASALIVQYNPGASAAHLNAVPPSVFAATPLLSFPEVLDTWKAKGTDPVRAYWEEARDDILRVLPTLHPRRRLAREQTGLLWAAWHFYDSDKPDAIAAVRERLKNFLSRLAKQRFGWAAPAEAAPGLYSDCRPTAIVPEATLRTLIDDHLAAFADTIAADGRVLPWSKLPTAVPIPLELEVDLVSTPTPHGWTVAVDRPDRYGESDVGKDEDLTRRVAGVGAILRQAATNGAAISFDGQPWRMLNAADVVAVTAVNAKVPAFSRAARRASVPVRGRYQDDARQTVITYDNQYLTAASLASAIAHFDGSLSDAATDDAFGPFRFTSPTKDQTGSDVPTDPLPTLKFGQCYELIPFLIGNCGTLPISLTTNHPAALATTIPDTFPELGADTAKYVRSIRYLRRVQVGLPRPDDNDALKKIMHTRANVLPLARELGLRTLSPTRDEDEYRFFYDVKWAAGQLDVGERWQLTIPRFIATGCAHNDPAEAQWAISFGLTDDTIGAGVFVRVTRASTQLKAMLTVNGTNFDEKEATLPAAGSVDVRLEAENGNVTLLWRESDRDAEWSDRDSHGNSMKWTPPAVPKLPHGSVLVRPFSGVVRPTFSPPTYGFRIAQNDDWIEDPVPPPETPLAVLRPDAATVEFKLRPPATDFQTWSRWYDMNLALGQDGATSEKRLDVWQNYHAKLPAPGRDAPPDLVPDDPGVTGVVFEWVPLLAEGSDAQPMSEYVPVSSTPHSNPTLPHVQAAPWTVKIQTLPAFAPLAVGVGGAAATTSRMTAMGSSVSLITREKEIWELRVYPCIPEKRFTGNANTPGERRFHSAFLGRQKYTADGTTYRLSTPWRLAVEVATLDVIQLSAADQAKVTSRATAAVAWAAAVPAFDGRHARVMLNKLTKPTVEGAGSGPVTLDIDPWRFRYVAEVRLRRQVWRWRGRPVPPFPFATANVDAFPAGSHEFDSPMLWDTAGFGDRSGIDMLDEVRGVNASSAISELFAEDLQNEGRALYYRFAAQYGSRYAGLFANAPAVIAAQHKADDTSPWRRLVVPARRTSTIPRPVVRFVLPLTEVTDKSGGESVPGMLLVLDESAFAVGGLAEAIEAEVVRVDDPVSDLSRPEWGPEVQARGKAWVAKDHPTPNGATGLEPPAVALPFDVDGPIGHTFDTDAEAPLFGSAAFIVSPPDVKPIIGDEPAALGGYFAKLRFRRIFSPEGTLDADLPFLPAPGYTWDSFNDDRALLVSMPLATAATERITLHDSAGTQLRIVNARRLDGVVRFDIDKPPAIVELPIEGNADVWIEVRFVFQNEETPTAGGGTVRSRHLTVSYRVPGLPTNTRANRWRTLQASVWPEEMWPTEVRVTAINPTVRLRPARVSAYTPPYWVQFLSNSAALLPAHAAEHRVRWDATDPKLQLVRDGVVSNWGLGRRVDWPPAGEGAEFRLHRRLLVTELVRDVRGQWGQERYLGLYSPKAAWLEREHRSPALAKDEREQDLPQVRVRVVEFQEDIERTDKLRYSNGSLVTSHQPWGALFDPPDTTTEDARTADVPYRVVRVSPPVTLLRESS